ncbi:RbsD/FucU family protein [Brenneria tiliae]|uniref:RbsD/FucU family protein n=1 Tax=Brenneria tiliae TaxID=2914984 RepID=A0ABT0MUB0_9GAMM|nr:RbsD/FucU family protein [Brenneria tiliae]MCL2893137.1 RbsD/FucU family protein [Brenneria tiliae]MCL2898176.1 RbsD/FucU family protein [Brenneria tiliae]MCL2902526.1 RbsD/FucU family protein [Brenneria tiliae]
MIKSEIIHPELLKILAQCGHKTNILIADANYSFVTNSSRNAQVVYLNFAPGMIGSTAILDKILGYINVEKATLMAYPDDFDNTIEKEYKKLLADTLDIAYVDRNSFYSLVKSDDTLLVIASGETRRFANILLTVGPILF